MDSAAPQVEAIWAGSFLACIGGSLRFSDVSMFSIALAETEADWGSFSKLQAWEWAESRGLEGEVGMSVLAAIHRQQSG